MVNKSHYRTMIVTTPGYRLTIHPDVGGCDQSKHHEKHDEKERLQVIRRDSFHPEQNSFH